MPRLEDLRTYRRHAEWALAAAMGVDLGLVDALASGPATADEVAGGLGLSRRGVRALLGPLLELGIVRREGESYRLTGAGRAFLVEAGSPDFQRPALAHWLRVMKRWCGELPAAVGSGEPPGGDRRGRGGPEDMAAFMDAMANKPAGMVEAAITAILARADRPATVLDIGGGPGSFARAFAERGLRVTLLDHSEVVRHVRAAFDLESVTGLELVEGDFLVDLPDGPFDVVLAANVSHIYSEEQNLHLFRRAAERLAPGGTLAVIDFVRERSAFAALFALTMLLATEAGGTYGLREYETWLVGAGLEELRCTPIDADTHLITARKPGGKGGP